MRIAVVGCGSIGRRHIRNLIVLGVQDIIGCDADPERLSIVRAENGITGFSRFPDVLAARPDAVVVCTPTSSHIPLAIQAAKAGCHLFIEKPLSNDVNGVDDLVKAVTAKGLITLIGSNYKFHPSFLKMKEILDSATLGRIFSARCQFGQYLPDWHPWEDYRKTYSARSDLGGGILLDSHEFDYMRWFLGEMDAVFCLSGKLSNLEIDTEDTAEILLRLKSKAVAEIHLDYTQRAYQRNFEFFGEHGTLKWDFHDRRVWLYRAEGNSWEVFQEPGGYDLNMMYVEEMKHFLDCVQNGKQTVTDIHSGVKILQAILAAKESARDGQIKKILNQELRNSGKK
jgi:predicted dehydrogenase